MTANELKEIRDRLDLTQNELADAIGIPPSRIQRFEQDLHDLSVEDVAKIEAYLESRDKAAEQVVQEIADEALAEEPDEKPTLEGTVLHEDEYTMLLVVDEPHEVYGVSHVYVIVDNKTGEAIETINFQKGPRKEEGLNGITDEDIARILEHRLKGFSDSEYADRYTLNAHSHAKASHQWLTDRKREREMRGVEGTSEK